MKTSAAVLALVVLAPSTILAEPSSPSPGVEQRRQSPADASAESEYNRGVRARVAKDWRTAAEAFQKALGFRPDFAEAWNELGYALRHQGRYAESIAAYDRALKLRPDFPEALEYLGEAYVKMGRIDEARRVLDRLRPLDGRMVDELAAEIAKSQ